MKMAVILAAGMGTRLQPYTHEIPKGFMSLGGETLIERSIRILRENGIERIVIGCGHLKEKYEEIADKYNLDLYFNLEYSTTGSFYTLCQGNVTIDSDFLLLESDLLYHPMAIIELLKSSDEDIILLSGPTNSFDEVYVQFNKKQVLLNLSKKINELEFVSGELVGIWKISYSLFQKLLSFSKTITDSSTIDYETAIARVSKEVHPVKSLKIDDLVWCEIDNEEHLRRANKLILPKLMNT